MITLTSISKSKRRNGEAQLYLEIHELCVKVMQRLQPLFKPAHTLFHAHNRTSTSSSKARSVRERDVRVEVKLCSSSHDVGICNEYQLGPEE